ncbi:MAG: crotonase/enoyl-CoA hydratase family protein [Betaproteobacteria bacterium]|nr:crotonase/enoyl-CoA hydratase family protein [Betaproteobacteria bacterium]
MSDFLQISRDGAVVIWTMNHPATRNALTGNTAIDEIVAAASAASTDPSVRAIILTGAGPVFSSGGNVKDMARFAQPGIDANAVRNEYRHGIQRIPKAMWALDVPIIAAVNGPAMGAGLDLACMCDIRIASDNATFAESFVRVGIVPGDGGAWLLPRAVGAAKAAEMAFTGDPISATEALACGLVSKVVAADTLLAEAHALAARIARNPAGVLRMTKRLLREGVHNTLESVLETSAAYQSLAHLSADHHEAVRAFIEKRPPKFS